MVPVGEETESTGMGAEKSECPHSTAEAGEPPRGTRGRKGGHRITEPVRGNEPEQPGPNYFNAHQN